LDEDHFFGKAINVALGHLYRYGQLIGLFDNPKYPNADDKRRAREMLDGMQQFFKQYLLIALDGWKAIEEDEAQQLTVSTSGFAKKHQISPYLHTLRFVEAAETAETDDGEEDDTVSLYPDCNKCQELERAQAQRPRFDKVFDGGICPEHLKILRQLHSTMQTQYLSPTEFGKRYKGAAYQVPVDWHSQLKAREPSPESSISLAEECLDQSAVSQSAHHNVMYDSSEWDQWEDDILSKWLQE
jgi:hypothetical protein